MPKFLVLFKLNPATSPLDPKVALKMAEANFATSDEMLNIVKEQGSFRRNKESLAELLQ